MDIYREEILDHFKNPRNFGELKKADVKVKETNASCGDIMEVGLDVKGDRLNKMRFKGEGCVVSVAAGSMLTEMVKDKKLKEIKKMKDEEMIKRLGIKISVTRRKCAILGLVALKKAIEKYEKEK